MGVQEGLKALPSDDDQAVEDLAALCANVLCRKEFRRRVVPGRRQEFCTELCRRTAEREYRRTLQRLAHFESQVEQLRIQAAAFGRGVTAGADDHGAVTPEQRRAAEDAITRVGGMMAFIRGSDEPLAVELCALYDAASPVIAR